MDQVTIKACEDHRKACADLRFKAITWAAGILITILLSLAIPLTAAAVAQRETNARQDERIRNLEENISQIREDVRDTKRMVQEIYQGKGK